MDGDEVTCMAAAARLHSIAYSVGLMPMWTIYQGAADYPDCVVARLFVIGKSQQIPHDRDGRTRFVLLAQTLPTLQAHLPLGLHRLAPDPNDDPTIVESWL